MNWQRPARYAVAVLGLSFAVMVYWFGRERPVVAPQPASMPSDPTAISEASRGYWDQIVDGATRFRIEYQGTRSYADGRSQFDDAHLVFGGSGREVWADLIEAQGLALNADLPNRLQLIGNVRLVEGVTLRVEADAATYDDASGRLEIPGHVTFTRGRMSGQGVGAVYNETAGIFRLLSEATVDYGVEGDSAAMTATGTVISFHTEQEYMQLEGDARIARPSETLAADAATVNFEQPEEGGEAAVRFVELRGRASVVPVNPGAGTTPTMRANDITLAFDPMTGRLQHSTLTANAHIQFHEAGGRKELEATWIDLYLASDGRTLTRLDARERVVLTLPPGSGTPARTISASTLTAQGGDAGLEAARFDGGTTFIEAQTGRDPGTESLTATSETLVLVLDGRLDALRQAEFRQKARIISGSVVAEAEWAEYDAQAGTMKLRINPAAPDQRPRVEDQGLTVDGEEIDIDLASDDLHARINVSTVSQPTDETSGEAAGTLFGGSAPIYGSAADFSFKRETGRAQYRGTTGAPARLIQDRDQLAADQILVEQDTRNLWAEGRVESILLVATTDPDTGEPKEVEYQVSADALVYDAEGRVATYDGQTVTMVGPDGTSSAEHVVVQLAELGRGVRAIRWTRAVTARLEGSHDAKGDALAYDAVTRTYTLTGSPAEVISPQSGRGARSGGRAGCTLVRSRQAVFTPGAGAEWRPSRPDGIVSQEFVPCPGRR